MGDLVAIPLPNGLFAAIWILLREDDMTSFLVLDGHSTARPTPEALQAAKPSRASSPPLPGVPDVWKGCFWGALAADFVSVATRAPTSNDLALMGFSGTMVFQDAEQLRAELYRHWRLLHDRDALFAEYQRAEDERDQRAKDRRRGLTLSKMAREKPFARWSARWPARMVREVHRIYRDATRALIDLEGGTKRQRTSVLRRIVTDLNALDDHEGLIETPEREALVARIEELASLVGLNNDDEQLTGHREW